MKKGEVLENFYNIISIDSERARREILKLNYSKDGYLLSQIALTYRDEAMFFKNGNTKKKFSESKLLIAKKYIDKAIKLDADCRDILFLRGTIYFALNDRFEAIDCYTKIIENGISLIAKYNCSNSDLIHVKMIVNDAHLQLYRLFKNTAPKLADNFLKEYKIGLTGKIKTIYLPLENFL